MCVEKNEGYIIIIIQQIEIVIKLWHCKINRLVKLIKQTTMKVASPVKNTKLVIDVTPSLFSVSVCLIELSLVLWK